MKKIGISARIDIENNGNIKNYKMVKVSDNYVKSVSKAGGVPFVIPLVEDINIVSEQLKFLDAIILTGGEDVNPCLYGEEFLEKNGGVNPERDAFDLKIIKKAMELKIPILGICRGCQILNVALGGTLYQDLSYKGNVVIKHNQGGNQELGIHKVIIEEKSFLGNLYGGEVLVNSFHHQAVKDIAPNLRVIAKSTDQVIEAYEYNNQDYFIIGIQWHPEMMVAGNDENMLKLFKSFINLIDKK